MNEKDRIDTLTSATINDIPEKHKALFDFVIGRLPDMAPRALTMILKHLPFLAAVVFGLLTSAFSQATHPQMLMDATELGFIRAKATANTTDWQTLKAQCDSLASSSAAVQWPAPLTGGSSRTRGYIAGSARSSPIIYTGYFGDGFYEYIMRLGACYQATGAGSNLSVSRPYIAQAHNIIKALAQPLLTMVRSSDGMTRYGLSIGVTGEDLQAGAPLTVYLYPNTALNVGDTWTISGAQGCTSMNGTWQLTAKSGNILSFGDVGGGSAPTLNANCTLYSVLPGASNGYGMRNWLPALSIAYDWFYDQLSSTEKANIIATMTAWDHEINTLGQHAGNPEDNFFCGNFWGFVSGYAATNGDSAASTLDSWLSGTKIPALFTAPHELRDYYNLWMAGGGHGEGWQAYGFGAARAIMNATLAMKMQGVDWTQSPYNFTFVNDTLRYWMQFTTPTLLELDDNEYVYPLAATEAGITAPVYIPLGHAAMFTTAATRFNSPYAAEFQSWYSAVYAAEEAAAGTTIPAWRTGVYQSQPTPVDYFLYYNPSAATFSWTSLPLMYRAWGGDYGVTRSDWNNNSSTVEVTMLGGPSVGNAGNGKTQFNSGAVTIQRGDGAHLVVYGLGEASRSGDIITDAQFNTLHDERSTYGNKKNSIFWAGTSQAYETHNQGLGSRTPPPGQISTVTSWASSIDRAYNDVNYTYWRANGLQANNTKSNGIGSGDVQVTAEMTYHQTNWTRELIFLRPKLIVVHDRTAVLNKGDDRAMYWTFGRNVLPVTSGVPAGVTRYDVCVAGHNPPQAGDSCSGTYRGTYWSVLPASPSTVSVVDHDDLHFLYRVEVRPSANDHTGDTWMSVLDAASSPAEVNTVTPLMATGADAVQFNDVYHTVVAFAQSDPPSSKVSITEAMGLVEQIHLYLAGLVPNGAYKVTISGSTVTVAAASDGPTIANAAGVVAINEGSATSLDGGKSTLSAENP